MAPPSRLTRVEWDAAVGYPEPERRQRTARNYTTRENAGRQVSIIEAMPSHLSLVAVYETVCVWEPVDPADLPRPEPTETEPDE
jgi:hypothetical protein